MNNQELEEMGKTIDGLDYRRCSVCRKDRTFCRTLLVPIDGEASEEVVETVVCMSCVIKYDIVFAALKKWEAK